MTVTCDMTSACERPIAYVDDGGYAYCEPHGIQRQRFHRCRKLRPAELRRILAGQPLERY